MAIPKVGEYFVLEIPEHSSKDILMITSLFMRDIVVEFETLFYIQNLNVFSFKEWDSDFFENESVRKATENEIADFEAARSKNSEFKDLFIFTEECLQFEANRLAKEFWDIDKYPKVALDFSEAVDGKGACFTVAYQLIEFWSETNRQRSKDQVFDTLLHELCHWYLYTTGQEYNDSDVRFAEELIRVGVGHTHNSNNPDAVKAFAEAVKRMCDNK